MHGRRACAKLDDTSVSEFLERQRSAVAKGRTSSSARGGLKGSQILSYFRTGAAECQARCRQRSRRRPLKQLQIPKWRERRGKRSVKSRPPVRPLDCTCLARLLGGVPPPSAAKVHLAEASAQSQKPEEESVANERRPDWTRKWRTFHSGTQGWGV